MRSLLPYTMGTLAIASYFPLNLGPGLPLTRPRILWLTPLLWKMWWRGKTIHRRERGVFAGAKEARKGGGAERDPDWKGENYPNSSTAGKWESYCCTKTLSNRLPSKISTALSAVTCVWQKQHLCIIWTVCFIIKYHLSLHLNLFSTSVRSGLNKALKTNSKTFTDHWLNMCVDHLSTLVCNVSSIGASLGLVRVKTYTPGGFSKLIS